MFYNTLKKMNWTYLGLSLVAASTFTMGCESQLTGNEGNLLFSYTADDNVADFNKPIAIGAKLELTVKEAGTRQAVDVQEAKSDDDAVLKVASFAGDRIVLEAVNDGAAMIEVEAKTASGEVVPDSVNMLAATPEVLKLHHTCLPADDPTGYYQAGATNILIPYDMERSNGQSVIGYGLFPFTQEPADALAVDQTSKDQAFFHFDLPAGAQTVKLTSTIDATSLTLEIIESSAYDGAEMNPLSKEVRVIADETHLLHFWPTSGGNRICQSRAPMQVETSTPDICEVKTVTNQENQLIVNESNYITLKGLAQGTCSLTITYADGNDGAGASTNFDVEIAAYAE